MNCPICNKSDINLNEDKCPQCDADLSFIHTIGKLQKRLVQRKLAIIFSIIAIILTIIFLSLYNQAKENIIDLKTERDLLIDSVNNANSYLNDVRINAQQTKQYIIYSVKRNDSLWELANYFYGRGNLFKKIMNENNLKSDKLIVGQKLKISIQ